MRADPALCFLEKVGMPDEKLLSAEQGTSDAAQDTAERWAGDGATPWGCLPRTEGCVTVGQCGRGARTRQTLPVHSGQGAAGSLI